MKRLKYKGAVYSIASVPLDLITVVTDYVGMQPNVRNFAVITDEQWVLLPESKEEWLYGGIAAIFTPDNDIVVRVGFESAAVHELLHATRFMPWGVNDFINEGVVQTVAEDICSATDLPIHRSYKEETSFVRRYLLRLWPGSVREFAQQYARADDKGELIATTLWDQYGKYFSDRDDWGLYVKRNFFLGVPQTIGYCEYLSYLVDELGLGKQVT